MYMFFCAPKNCVFILILFELILSLGYVLIEEKH